MKVKALRGFDYPASAGIRDRIRSGDHMSREVRGDLVDVEAGAIVEVPDDIVNGLLRRGVVERAEEFDAPRATFVEDVSDDTEG